MAYSVAQNASFLTVASVLQKMISSVYFVIIARFIGVENTGAYFTVLSSIAIFTIIADGGFGVVLTRETAKTPEKAGEYLSTVVISKLCFAVLAVAALLVSRFAFTYPPQAVLVVVAAAVTLVCDSLQNIAYGLLRANKNLLFESLGVIGSQALTLCIGAAALVMKLPLVWLIIAYAVPSFLASVYGTLVVRCLLGLKLCWHFDRALFKRFARMAWPFAVAGLLTRLYSYSDSIVMVKLLPLRQIGWWSTAYKLTYAFQFIPTALTAGAFPAMSALLGRNPAGIAALYERCARYLITVSVPLAIGIASVARPFIHLAYGTQFLPAAVPLQIMVGSLIGGFLVLLNGSTLNALGKQRTQMGLLAGTLVLSFGLNMLLIPRLGIVGGAITALATNFLLALVGLLVIKRCLPISLRTIGRSVWMVAWPAILMGGMLYWLAERLPLPVTVATGIGVYGVLLFLSGAVTLPLVREIKNTLWKRPESKL